jgi:hypothetical protein
VAWPCSGTSRSAALRNAVVTAVTVAFVVAGAEAAFTAG